MTPKISLIIPVYNVEKYLEKCLGSAVSQTLKEIEIIVINDGSTDNSLEICKKYATKDPRVKLITQENSGLGNARNNGLLLAKGEFVCFLDSDDWLDIETLKVCFEQAKTDNSDVVIFSFERIEEATMKVVQTRDDLDFDTSMTKETFIKRVFSGKLKLMACSMIARKKLFLDHNLLFPSTLHEDIYVMPEIYYFANKVSITKQHFYKWLIRSNSITNTIGNEHVDGIVNAIYSLRIFMLRQHIYKKYEKEFALFTIRYLNLLFKRIKHYKIEQKIKDELNNVLMFHALHIFNINILSEIKDEELVEFKAFLYLINRVKLKEISTIKEHELKVQNKNLNNQLKNTLQQLSMIQTSNGYKLIKKYYNFRDYLLPRNSKRRSIINNLIKRIKKFKKYPFQLISSYDVVFIPHKDYHVWTMGLIAEQLRKEGISSCMIDITDYYRDEGSRQKAKDFPTIPFLDYGLLRDEMIKFNTLICMNDWDKKIVRAEIIKAKKMGKKTIGIVEGIQDFFDLDTKQNRKTYKTVEYVLLTGEHDRQFFMDHLEKTQIVGLPRLTPLLKENVIFPEKPLAIINMNFSYNVLVDKAEKWLQSAIEGCKKANIDYIITQHPADKTELKGYKVTDLNMYETIRQGSIVISRFSSTILEALAMGKPVVYHNPHSEQAIKFQEPLNAYSLSFDSDSLAEAINYELSLGGDYRKRANKFLDYHCYINSEKPSALLSAEKIRDIVKGNK